MPVMDGVTAAKEIRKFEERKRNKKVDILFVTGDYSIPELEDPIFKVGPAKTFYLKKPIDVTIVKNVVKNYSPDASYNKNFLFSPQHSNSTILETPSEAQRIRRVKQSLSQLVN